MLGMLDFIHGIVSIPRRGFVHWIPAELFSCSSCLNFCLKCVYGFIFDKRFSDKYFFSPESQTEISEVEQDLKRAQDLKIELERKMRIIEEEKMALEKVGFYNLESLLKNIYF